MRLPELVKYIDDEKFNYFIVESCELKCFGFNLKNKHQREAVDQLIQGASIFTINGWKVARQIPKWVNGFDAFLQFMEDNWNIADKYEYDFEIDINVDDKNNVEDEVDENGEDEMEDVQEEDDDEEDEDMSEEEEESDENGEDGSDDDEEENEEKKKPGIVLNDGHMKTKKAVKLDQYLLKGSDDDEEDNKKKKKSGIALKSGDFQEKETTKLAQSSMSNEENLFNSICVGNMKEKLADTKVIFFKKDTVDVHISGPYHNVGKSHWVVVYGENKDAFMLKSAFCAVYISCLLRQWKQVTKSNINVDHCNTYYDIGIRKHQFGSESIWKRIGAKNSPVNRVSFVYSHDIKIGDTAGKEEVIGAINFFFMSMKERVENPIGPLLLDHIHEKAEKFYNYFLGESKTEEMAAEKITRVINKHFSGGPNMIWNDHLNHWLVDYDIIRILRNHMGYKSWSEVQVKERQLCYKGYTAKNDLPPWDVQKERY
jgi:hypothetical protein